MKLLILLLFPSILFANEYADKTEVRYSFHTNEYLSVSDEYHPPLPPPPEPKQFEITVDKSSYSLTVSEDLIPLNKHKVIIGRPGKETPTLKTTLSEVVLNPIWIVPQLLEQDFVALMRKQKNPTAYLNKKGFTIKDGETIIDPNTIDWKTLPSTGPYDFSIYQSPGPKNFIGQVLFKLENSGDIQMHDTPDKYLFKKEIRKFSAGCVRIENAISLATLLIDKDPESVQKIISSGKSVVFKMHYPIDINIVD